jgi:hypothetical protein
MAGIERRERRSVRRRRRAQLVGLLVGVSALTAAALAPAAHAQSFDGPAYAFPVPDYSSQLISDAALEAAKGGGGDDRQRRRGERAKRPKRPTARQRAKLRFRPSEQVMRDFDQRLVDAFALEFDLDDPTLVLNLLDAGRREFRAMLTAAPEPWDPDNVGDVAAGVLVLGYEEVKAKTSVPLGGKRALRRVVHDALASSRRIRRQSDAEQQTYAEELLQMAMLHGSGIHLAQNAGDTTLAAERREGMRSWIQDTLGLDVGEIKLTKRGLGAR